MDQPTTLAEQIAQIEAALALPLPVASRTQLEHELARLRALQSSVQGTVTNSGTLHGNAIGVNFGTVQAFIGGAQPSAAPAGQPARAAPPEHIASMEKQLRNHRRALGTLLEQIATLGSAFAPPSVSIGIDEARVAIRRAKAALRGWGVAVEDLPNDEEPEE